MPAGELASFAREALFLSVALAFPILAIAAVVGLIVAAFQAASQIQDPTIAHLPRMVATVLGLLLLGPAIGHQVASFAERMLMMAAR